MKRVNVVLSRDGALCLSKWIAGVNQIACSPSVAGDATGLRTLVSGQPFICYSAAVMLYMVQ